MLKEMLPNPVKGLQNSEIKLYATAVCPKCKRLKDFLQSQGITFQELDMQSPEGITELRFAGCFALEAPVLQVNNDFYTTRQIFQGNEISNEIKRLITL
jgi:glutaredoxin